MKRALAAALLVVVAGCANRPFVLDVAAPLSFKPLSQSQDLKQAKLGDILFEQLGAPIEVVRLNDGVEQNVPVRTDAWHRVPSGTPLFRVYGANQKAATYCTTKVTFTSTMPIGGTYRARSCFTDVDGDKTFDQIWLANWIEPSAEVQISWWQDLTALSSKVGYSAADATAVEPLGKGLIYAGTRERPRLQLFYRLSGKPFPIGDAAEKPLLGAGFPKTAWSFNPRDDQQQIVSLGGARVEIAGIAEGVVTYRILSGFPNDPTPLIFSVVPCENQGVTTGSVCEMRPFTP